MKKIFLLFTTFLAIGSNAQNANIRLSNLSPNTTVSHSLRPFMTSSINLGSSEKQWRNLYLSGRVSAAYATFSGALDITGDGLSINTNGTGIHSVSSRGVSIYGQSIEDEGIQGVGIVGVIGGGGVFGVYGSGSVGVHGTGPGGGISGSSDGGSGVAGSSTSGYGGDFESTSGDALHASTSGTGYAGNFNGNVFTTGSYLPSDKNLKKNVQDFSSAMNIINQLKPKSYEYKDDANLTFLHLPKGNHYGLIAQDLEMVLPNLVKESTHKNISLNSNITAIKPSVDGKPYSFSREAITELQSAAKAVPKENITIKAVNYTELIPIMIKGMQEQQTQMQELITKNETLQNQLNELKSLMAKSGNTTSAISANGYLKQNVPNPVNHNTVISYYLPDHTARAQIRVTDEKGSSLKVYNASAGEGQVNIASSELPAGIYNYTLYVNDKIIDTKQMIITK